MNSVEEEQVNEKEILVEGIKQKLLDNFNIMYMYMINMPIKTQ